MTGSGANGRIDQLVKARWLALGLSQTDLAEILNAALEPAHKDGNGSDYVDKGRLMQVADALEIPIDFSAARAEPERESLSSHSFNSSHSLLELRLLRAFHELQDPRTRRMLIHLAEQFAKRQNSRRGNAG
jgi:transcriptional regulator with XRE-family HTH domain